MNSILAMFNPFDDPAIVHSLIGLGIILGCAIIGKLLKEFLNTAFLKLIRKTKNTLDDRIVVAIAKNVFALSIIAGVYYGIGEVRGVLDLQRTVEHRVLDYLTIGVYIVLVLILARLVSQILKAIAEWYVEDISQEQHKDISSTVPIASKIVNIALLTIALLIILDHIGVNVGSLLVSLGVGSLAIALAAQETISNLIAWFVIVLDQPFRVGDTVRLSSGEEGTIQFIGLRATRLLNYDNNIVVVPNGELVKSRLINFSLPVTTTRVLLEFTLAFGTDIEAARKIMIEIASKNSNLLKEPEPRVYVMNFTDTGVLVRFVSRSLMAVKFDAETALREEFYKQFTRAGIQFAIPQRISRIIKESDGSQTS